jgi:hypothetical protein
MIDNLLNERKLISHLEITFINALVYSCKRLEKLRLNPLKFHCFFPLLSFSYVFDNNLCADNLRRVNDRSIWSELLKLILNFHRPLGSQLLHLLILKDVVFMPLLLKPEKYLIKLALSNIIFMFFLDLFYLIEIAT